MGIAKCYRHFNGDVFTRGGRRQQVVKAFLLLLVVSSAVLVIEYQPDLQMFSNTEEYIVSCVLYYLLFYIVFDFLPTVLFVKLKLVPEPTYLLLHNPIV